jgi:protein-disulfide isomerase
MTNRIRVYCLMIELTVAMSAVAGSPAAQDKVQTAGKAVASIDGSVISEEELNKAAAADLEKLELQKLQFEANLARNRHQVLENTLKRLVEDRLLDAEAARQGISRKDLLAREVDQKVKDPTPEEVSKFYESNKGRINAPKEQVASRIQQYLKQQEYNTVKEEFIDRLKKDRKVVYSLEPLRTDVSVVGEPARGPQQAPVTIVEFSDFQCPYCRSFSATLDRVIKEFGPDVRVVFRQFPLGEIHAMAEKAAEASLCAQEQGKFWELHDLMFKDQTNLKVSDLKAKAAQLGLDTTAFDSCLDSGKYGGRVRQDLHDGAVAGASGTPAFLVNGRFYSGARPYEEVAAIIKEELSRKAVDKSVGH